MNTNHCSSVISVSTYLFLLCGGFVFGRTEFARDFAPSEGWVKPVEQPYRQDLCLNGRWQFQPMPLPGDWKRGTGVAPELPSPAADRWETTPIKIPSPWNVNAWGAGRNVGDGSPNPYWPSSVYFPSYPVYWEGVEMGWLRRTFRVPASWEGRRIVLHFEAVGGDAQVFVNGAKAGGHFDRYLPFELDVTALVKRDADNELLVGVRSMRLFDQTSATYKFMRTPYPPGSNTDNLTGIWQDVFLLGLPSVRVADVFIKPWVDRDTLEAEVTLRNDTDRQQSVDVTASVQPWVNLAGAGVLDAPEPKWRLDPPVMNLPPQTVSLKAGESKTVTLSETITGRLRFWSPDTPNLYGLVLSVNGDGQTLDRSYTRFGWRQCKIAGRDFLLNGKKVTLFADLLHPFGPFVNSRRYTWAWYRMIKDMHGNAVRPHAQPHPRHYLDLADEMGLLVLDETAMFGSSLQLNFEAPAAWDRYAEHYDNLILRDRNHPSVFGWSWGNELFAIFIYDKAITQEQTDAWYNQLAQLGGRGRRLDPTRDWFSCDGDEDVRGSMPVWNKHFGHGLPHPDWLPKDPTKPVMVGESGGTYYARPAQLAVFNGPRAYESYLGRNEALAIDVYDNIVNLARKQWVFFSPAETAWFGIEHLNLGYSDFTRLPNATDGVWLKPFEDGKPGIQPERIPPYVCTLNPGWDPDLPLYKPLPMFEAQKAAQAPDNPQPCAWDHKIQTPKPSVSAVPATIDQVAFVGARDGELFQRLTALGLPLVPSDSLASPKLALVDAVTLTEEMFPAAKKTADATIAAKGTVMVMLTKQGQTLALVNLLLPEPVTLTSRTATALVARQSDPWTSGFGLPDLYFAEDPADKKILKCGLDGPFVKRGKVLLDASNTDWSLFNDQPENAKCAAVVLYEHLAKPSGAALVTLQQGEGAFAVSAMDCVPKSPANAMFWRTLFTNMGVHLVSDSAPAGAQSKDKPHDLLLNGPPENKP
jgi:beta-galactosidase